MDVGKRSLRAGCRSHRRGASDHLRRRRKRGNHRHRRRRTLSADLREAHPRTRRVARPHRDEHTGRTAPRVRGIPARDIPKTQTIVGGKSYAYRRFLYGTSQPQAPGNRFPGNGRTTTRRHAARGAGKRLHLFSRQTAIYAPNRQGPRYPPHRDFLGCAQTFRRRAVQPIPA